MIQTILAPNAPWPVYNFVPQPRVEYQPQPHKRKYTPCDSAVRAYMETYPGSRATEIVKGTGVQYQLVSDHLKLMVAHGMCLKRGKEYYLL